MRGIGNPLGLLDVICLAAVPAYSVVAFWLYSIAMRRAAITAATSAETVAQTFVPAGIGVWQLGDGVRDGWWPVLVVGLLVAICGAVALGARSEVSTSG